MQHSDKRWAARASCQPNQQDSKHMNETTIQTHIYIDVSSWAISWAIVQTNCQMIAQTIAQAISWATTGANFFSLFLKKILFSHNIKLSSLRKIQISQKRLPHHFTIFQCICHILLTHIFLPSYSTLVNMWHGSTIEITYSSDYILTWKIILKQYRS